MSFSVTVADYGLSAASLCVIIMAEENMQHYSAD